VTTEEIVQGLRAASERAGEGDAELFMSAAEAIESLAETANTCTAEYVKMRALCVDGKWLTDEESAALVAIKGGHSVTPPLAAVLNSLLTRMGSAT
jgi:hypothetical protein